MQFCVRIMMLLFVVNLLLGCAGKDKGELPSDTGEQQIYKEAQRYLNSRNFNLAVRTLQLLESRYPFGRYAEQAQLELIYAHYGAYEREAASEAADRFIRLHPQHPNIDYAYYMKGLSAYSKGEDFLARFLPIDTTKRDANFAKESFAEFSQVVSRYPDSPYATDARYRMVHLRNLLARQEINVANYYLRRGAYLAALNRGRYVVENMQRTSSVPDGLAIIAQSYFLLDMEELAKDTVKTLALNYPEHPSLDKDGNFQTSYSIDGFERSWINRASFGLFDPPKPPQFYYEPPKKQTNGG